MLVTLFVNADCDNFIIILCMRKIFHAVVRTDVLILKNLDLHKGFEDVEHTSLMMLRGSFPVILLPIKLPFLFKRGVRYLLVGEKDSDLNSKYCNVPLSKW